ncbi:P-loop containing nucleoside triphosphate hydrolase protein [Penicillium riverlandense]|uniref:P-loop containing nucleoside triphosphate hydrolase protein n=1 Tax=Penicillium riverlandense TaxID=1903569 RepID=UPI00254819D2|nr:P-loop containing nucleoside triphosphate hydrolase protein [Penicillium riverlandense]KAJ5812061.1 P-loop containing nucleoside triphosphate hydrolase protein [Penicillium riverlandense]
MLDPQVTSFATGGLAVCLVGLVSIPAIKSITSRVARKAAREEEQSLAKGAYRDEDGEATEESLRAFSDKWQRILITLTSISGLLVTLALAVLTTLKYNADYTPLVWLQFGVWIFLSIQTVVFFTEPRPTRRFDHAGYALWGSLIAVALPGAQIALASYGGRTLPQTRSWVILLIVQIACALFRGFFCAILPRRPDVYFEGQVVDQQFTVSVLSRFSFTWASTLLQYAVKNRTLDIESIPKLPLPVRAHSLRANFERALGSRKIWKAIIFAHYKSIGLQMMLTLAACILSFGPQVALYNILNSMEARGTESWAALQSWMWVFALGIMMLVSSSVDSWLFWVICYRIGLPIYESLSATIFAKAMRRKDAKHTKKSKDADTKPDASSKALLEEPEEDDDEEAMKKSRQSVINLVAVDARRIADFATFNYLIPLAITKVLLGCAFLVKILGWRSTLAGLGVSLLVTPLNIYVAKKFSNAQDRLMKARDQKMAVVTEVLQGIRQIKFSALEEQWQNRIGEVRETELAALWSSFLYDIGLISIWILGPVGLSAVSLTVYAVIHGGLEASVAFTAMSVFGALELSLAIIPELMADGLEAKVSADRIDKYMKTPDKVVNTVPAENIAFENASVAWPADQTEDEAVDEDRFALRSLDVAFPMKGLSVVSGRTGSGKSLLLSCLLGECEVLEGTVKVPVPPPISERFDHLATSANWIIDSAIAYVAQIPWIENASIKDNILFGLPFDPERYQKVLFACALQKDFDMLPDGELTDIGANGVNLSGGQRWRVSFARALYSRAGILIMDDIFSALDAHTGRHVYEHALTGELGQNRTRILVTHHVALCLPRTDYSVLLENGCVKYAGTIDELKKSNHLEDILREENAVEEGGHVAAEGDEILNDEETTLQKVISNTSHQHPSTGMNGATAAEPTSTKTPRKFVEEEKRETGRVKLAVYAAYLSQAGHWSYWLLASVVYVGNSVLMVGRAWWVNVWTSSSSNTQAHPEQFSALLQHPMNATRTTRGDDNLAMYLSIYVGISVLACVVGTARYYFILNAAVKGSRNLFKGLVFAVLRAPLRWLDTVPLGRILNRFTADFHMIDSRLGYDIGFTATKLLEVIGVLVAGMLVSPVVIIFAVALLLVSLKLALTYLAGAREIKRIESIAKSPVFEQFGSSLAGLVTIRAFSKSETYIGVIYNKINRHAQAWWYMWLFNRWLGFRMNLIGAVFATFTAALVVYMPGITASLAGFALSFALQFNSAIAMALRQYASTELNMNATERVIEYSSIELENQGGADAPAAWPTEGRLEVTDLVVGYAPDLPPVLNGLSFTVEKNQRVGVVGRTGAGKSSLTLALFRFLEARAGQILIDGLDVSKIKLHDLRSRLAIIPQDPVLFSGTVRSNLDPFGEYSDQDLYDALARVHLISSTSDDDETLTSRTATPRHPGSTGATTPDTATATANANTNIFTSLSATISEGGLNLSQGQRQLLCLARAIVARPKIMVLDEATSAVDMETDALIQTSIRAEFGRNATTLLVIAHRLSTIADFDRILVLDAGKAVEFGSPKDLMGIEGGVFKNLVDNSGEKDVLQKMIFG